MVGIDDIDEREVTAGEPLAQATGTASLADRAVSQFQRGASRAIRWSRREVLLAFFAAFIAGLGAGAAEALISWALS